MAKIKAAVHTAVVILILQLSTTAKAQNIMDGTFELLGQTLQPSNVTNATHPFVDVSEKCYWDTVTYMTDVFEGELYARNMYHSSGSFRQDYDLTWNFKDVGDFTRCKAVISDGGYTGFLGKYCLTETIFGPGYSVLIAVCYPNSCSDEDILTMASAGFKEAYPGGPLPFLPYATTLCSPEDYPYTIGDIVAVILCTMLLIVIVISTSYDFIKRRRQKKFDLYNENNDVTSATNVTADCNGPPSSEITIEEPIPQSAKNNANENKRKITDVLIAFSALDAGEKILNASPSKGSIGCLNGVRVLSMFWIILYHTWLIIPDTFTHNENVRYVFEVVKPKTKSAILVNGEFGVEAFFVLGGLLVSYITLKQIDKCGGPRKHKWWLFYFHRFWRLTPVYAFILMIYTTLTIHMGDGIWWPYWYGAQGICKEGWWANLLYVHNLIPFPGTTSQCMGWSWYLSTDMQLYCISPLFIVLFYKKWVAGVIVSVITTLCSFAISAYFNYALGRTMGLDEGPYGDPQLEEGAWLYTKPYYRISQYLIGIVIGYVLFRLKGKKLKIHKALNVFLWCCSTLVAVLVIYGPYFGAGEEPRPQGAAILYLSIHRFLLSVCIGWVIFACATGNGGPVNSFLAWSGWLPLARMNYCAYLLHLTVIFLYMFGLKHLYYYTEFDFALTAIGITAITYAAAFLFTLALEVPMASLEKVLIPSKGKKKS